MWSIARIRRHGRGRRGSDVADNDALRPWCGMMADGPIVPRDDGRQRRSCPRVLAQVGGRNDEINSPMPNAWPTGLRTMGCLACDAAFVSTGRDGGLGASVRRRKG